jgi:hypothetical protein
VGYILFWGTNSGNYCFTNYYFGAQTNATVTNLLASRFLYFAVAVCDSNGLLSDFSNEAVFQKVDLPPLPPTPDTNLIVTLPPSTNTPPSTNVVLLTTNAPVQISGIPPFLAAAYKNKQTKINIWGTLGAVVKIETMEGPRTWVTVTNLFLTNTAPRSQFPAPDQTLASILTNAFVPAYQEYAPPASTHGFFRIVMSGVDDPLHRIPPAYYYLTLAGVVLQQKGYHARLVNVKLPGLDDCYVCYVNEEGCYIACDTQTYAFKVQPAGTTIRQIATTVADSHAMNWTSAQEFVCSNGLYLALATVIKTDDPANDPVATGQPVSSIKIDF